MVLLAVAVGVMAVAILVLVLSVTNHRRQTAAELRSLQEMQQKDEGMQLLNQNVLGLRQSVEGKVKEVNDRLSTAADTFTRVQRDLGRLDKLGESVEGLQSMLGSQKLRGNLGEQVMVDLLKDFIPADYRKTQVTLRSGVRVDAAVETTGGMIPIDAKFPLENYAKATRAKGEDERKAALHELYKNARKHIRDIASKYICPGETTDFAVMYVPSEAVYSAILEDPEILQAARSRVFIVSPSTFCAFLSLVMLNLEGERLADEARGVMSALRSIQQLAGKFESQLSITAGHVRKAGNAIGATDKQWEKLKDSIDAATQLEIKADVPGEPERPDSDDAQQHLRAV